MDQCEDRGAPPCKTTDRTPTGPVPDSQPKAQRPGPGPKPEPGLGPEPGSGPEPGPEHEPGPKPGPPSTSVSYSSENSKHDLIYFKHDRPSDSVIHQRPESSGPGTSCVSYSSDWSMDKPANFQKSTQGPVKTRWRV
ncbi:protein TsetseEP-like [Sphaeramia orbicularis]|nr:protein TsetseEP-like [Sphaeramia orbicularis]